jgi:lactobin A/cerein 7B family class IIb bacteriocin
MGNYFYELDQQELQDVSGGLAITILGVTYVGVKAAGIIAGGVAAVGGVAGLGFYLGYK